MKYPVSPTEEIQGMVYFPRMISKIHLHAAGELPPDYHEHLGGGFDKRCCDFLKVSYDALAEQVLGGLSDEQALEWCFKNGVRRNADEIFVWSEFMRKRGWNDEGAETLEKRKSQSGFTDRADIRTMFNYIDADEGRPVQP